MARRDGQQVATYRSGPAPSTRRALKAFALSSYLANSPSPKRVAMVRPGMAPNPRKNDSRRADISRSSSPKLKNMPINGRLYDTLRLPSSQTTVANIKLNKTAIAQGKALLSAWRLSDKKIMLRHGEIDAGCGCGCQPAE